MTTTTLIAGTVSIVAAAALVAVYRRRRHAEEPCQSPLAVNLGSCRMPPAPSGPPAPPVAEKKDLTFWDQMKERLSRIGYTGGFVPPLSLAASLAMGDSAQALELWSQASPNNPIDLGPAFIVALEKHRQGLLVVRLVGHGDFYGNLNFDLFIAGKPDVKGRLFYCGHCYILCSDGATVGQAVAIARRIPVSRDLVR